MAEARAENGRDFDGPQAVIADFSPCVANVGDANPTTETFDSGYDIQ